MKLRLVLIRAKDGKRIEKPGEYTTPEKVNNTCRLFFPKFYKAYAIYDGDRLLYSQG